MVYTTHAPEASATQGTTALRPEMGAQQGAQDAIVRIFGAAVEAERRLTQALGVIVEFGDLNGFRNLSDEELVRSVSHMARACAETLDRLRVAIALFDPAIEGMIDSFADGGATPSTLAPDEVHRIPTNPPPPSKPGEVVE